MVEVPDFVIRAFRATGFNHESDVHWSCDGEYAPITLFINCNDLFYWGTADAEEITAENIQILEDTIKEFGPYDMDDIAMNLFCCRSRKMRPQIPFYKHIKPEHRHLFDACGPARTQAECG